MPQVTMKARSVREEPGRVTVQIKHPERAEVVEFSMSRDLYQQTVVVAEDKPAPKAKPAAKKPAAEKKDKPAAKKTTKKTTKAK